MKYLYEIPICKQANAHFPVNCPLLHTLLTHEKLNSPISCKFEMQLKESSPMTIFSGTPEAKLKQWNSQTSVKVLKVDPTGSIAILAMNTTMAQETKLRKKDSMCQQCPQEAEKLVRPENER